MALCSPFDELARYLPPDVRATLGVHADAHVPAPTPTARVRRFLVLARSAGTGALATATTDASDVAARVLRQTSHTMANRPNTLCVREFLDVRRTAFVLVCLCLSQLCELRTTGQGFTADIHDELVVNDNTHATREFVDAWLRFEIGKAEWPDVARGVLAHMLWKTSILISSPTEACSRSRASAFFDLAREHERSARAARLTPLFEYPSALKMVWGAQRHRPLVALVLLCSRAFGGVRVDRSVCPVARPPDVTTLVNVHTVPFLIAMLPETSDGRFKFERVFARRVFDDERTPCLRAALTFAVLGHKDSDAWVPVWRAMGFDSSRATRERLAVFRGVPGVADVEGLVRAFAHDAMVAAV